MTDQKTPDCPGISDALIAYLDAQFPERAPEFSETYERLQWRGGQTSVVGLFVAAWFCPSL
jgi:hypothetical protein